MSDKEEGVVIEEEKEVSEPEEKEFSIEGLTDGEITLAKEHGLYKEGDKEEKEDGEHKVDTESTEKDNSEDEDKKTEEKEVDKDKKPEFDEVEDNEDLLDRYSKPEQALYWKWKTDKQKRQESQKREKELEEKLKEAQEGGASKGKIDKIKDLLKNPDSLTIEALESVLGEKIDIEENTNEHDPQEIQRRIAMKAQFAEKIGSAKYDNFNAISDLAKEVISNDKSDTYQKLIDEAFVSDDIDETMLVERVVSIARFSPKYNEVVNQVNPEDKENIDRALNNSKKKVSSASVSGASGKRIISEKELTVSQASRLTTQQWNKLKESTRERILKGIDP